MDLIKKGKKMTADQYSETDCRDKREKIYSVINSRLPLWAGIGRGRCGGHELLMALNPQPAPKTQDWHEQDIWLRYTHRLLSTDKGAKEYVEFALKQWSIGIDTSELKLDTLTEFTTAQGVTIEGVQNIDSNINVPGYITVDTINEYTRKIAIELGVVGLMNIQYAICDDKVYILEANPRASRTVPLVSKVCALSMARIATQLMLGKKLADLKLTHKSIPHYGVKESVFPFYFYPEVDPVLGPEMRSTGEVLGLADSFGLAFYKAQEATQGTLPVKGTVLMTIADKDKGPDVVDVARRFESLKFNIKATEGTRKFLAEHGIEAEHAYKIREQRPHIADDVMNGGIQLVINTPMGKVSKVDDSYIRKAAIRYKVPHITTISAALAAAKGIAAIRKKQPDVRSLQDYHAGIS